MTSGDMTGQMGVRPLSFRIPNLVAPSLLIGRNLEVGPRGVYGDENVNEVSGHQAASPDCLGGGPAASQVERLCVVPAL